MAKKRRNNIHKNLLRGKRNKHSNTDKWEVRAILDHKVESSIIHYLIDWTPTIYESFEPSWEPATLCSCDKLVVKYWEKLALTATIWTIPSVTLDENLCESIDKIIITNMFDNANI